MKHKITNKLSEASSPYLLQHAHNPVEWYEWGEEALQRSKKENKPLLISIGYAACHWCHVMAHESFEDTEVAAYMNANFINIKIDREERPDIDQLYMDAAQLITGRGGWPLNAFALPDGRPFYAGTYFPKENWMRLLEQITELYKSDYQDIEKQAIAVSEGISKHNYTLPGTSEPEEFKSQFYASLFGSMEIQIDYTLGGFKRAPKFPLPISWEFMLQNYYLEKNKNALKAVDITLSEMAKGGIYDQVGGGFSRYSVDESWKVPHFEKMLYDNGQLASLYSQAFQITQNHFYERIIRETLRFIEAELMSPEGGFYSSLDADSEGEEGKFYVFTEDEIKRSVKPENLQIIKDYFGISSEGNWEHGKNILHIKQDPLEFESKKGFKKGEFMSILEDERSSLLNARSKRVRPGTDDKILCSWNAIMLMGYIDAYQALGDSSFLDVALVNATFIEKNLIQADGSLYRNYKDGRASISGFLDDYAFLSLAYLELYQVTFDIHWLTQSKKLADFALKHFSDDGTGLFFYTSDLSEKLFARKHEVSDNVIPSSNSTLAKSLFILGHLFEDESYTNRAKMMLKQVEPEIASGGAYYSNWAILYGMVAHGIYEVAIMGSESRDRSLEIQKKYLPNAIFLGGSKENLKLLEGKYNPDRTMIYVCKGKVCKLPVSHSAEAIMQIEAK